MQNVTQQFMDASLALSRELVSKITIKTADDEWELGARDIRGESITVTSSCMEKGFELGGVTASSLSFSLDNRDGRWNDVVLDGATVIPYCGYVLEGGTSEYVPMGVFIVDEPSRPYGTLTVKAADRLILLDEPLSSVSVTYPTSPYALLNACATRCNIVLSPKVATISHISDIIIQAPKADSMTCRDAVSEIALMFAGFARMSRDGQLEIIQVANPATYANPHVMPLGSRKNFKATSDELIITGLKYGNKILGTDDYAIEIEPLELLSTGYEDEVLRRIWQTVEDFTYTAYEADYYGNPALDVGDVVLHEIRDDKTVLSLITKHTYKHGGSCKMQAEGESKSAVGYKGANQRRLSSVASKVKDDLKEQLSGYELASAQMSDMLGLMLGVYRSEETLDDGSTVYYFHDKPTLEESTEIWKFNGKVLGFSDDGGLSWSGVSVNSSLVIKIIETVGLDADWIETGTLDADLIKIGNQSIKDVLAQLAQDVSGLTEGGGNYLHNSNLGAAGVADGAFWGAGMTWRMLNMRWRTWKNLNDMGLTWNELINNLR